MFFIGKNRFYCLQDVLLILLLSNLVITAFLYDRDDLV